MPSHTELERLRRLQEQRNALSAAPTPTLPGAGFVRKDLGQTGFLDALSNPTGNQLSAIGDFGLSLLASDPQARLSGRIANALLLGTDTLAKGRTGELKAKLAKRDADIKEAQTQFENQQKLTVQQRLASQGTARTFTDPETGQQRNLIETGEGRFIDPQTNKEVFPANEGLVKATGPLVQINNPIKPPQGFFFNDPQDPSAGAQPIPGGPADIVTPEQAAKAQLVQGAIDNQVEIDQLLFNDDGTVDRINVANLAIGTPFSEGRSLNVLLKDSIEAKLRAESGAAVPETEVKRAAVRFSPSVLDSDATINIKRKLLKQFLEGTFDKFDPTGRFNRINTMKAATDALTEELAVEEATSGSTTTPSVPTAKFLRFK